MEKRRFSIERKTAAIIILSILLIVSLSYIGWTSFQSMRANELNQAYALGYNAGFEKAITSIMSQSQNCTFVPLYAGNVTKTLVDVACLRQPQNQTSSK